MITIERYLIRQIVGGLLITAIVLIPLFSFLDLIEQLDDVGQGFYTVKDAFRYVVLLLPRRFIQLAPFIALIGNVIALGRLAVNLELISMRIAGMSPTRISNASLKTGLVLLLIMAVMEQFIAPDLQQQAISLKSEALEQSTELGKNLGVWTRDEQNILRVGETRHTGRLADVEIFKLDSNGMLSQYIYAEYAIVRNENEWEIHDVIKKDFNDMSFKSKKIDSMIWVPFLKPDQLSTLSRPVESLSPLELYQYIHYLKKTGQQYDAYSLALWRKIGAGFITISMILLSVPFVFGSVRTGIANRIVLACILGVCVYLLDQIISNVGLILNLSIPFVALTPGLLLFLLARTWLKKIT